MKNAYLILSSLFVLTLLLPACTDLEVEEFDSVVVESASGEFAGVDPTAALVTAYANLRGVGDQNRVFTLSEVPTDEMLVPTRGTDWGDNGVFRTLHSHTWDATHPQVRDAWNELNSNVFRINQLLDSRSGASTQQIAEGRFLRAWNMFWILDFWGKIPFREVDEGPEVNPRVLETQEAFDFIMADLNAAIPDLPSVAPGSGTISASIASANYLKAKMLLNKHAWLGGSPAASDMTDVVTAVNAIEAEGYDLEQGYFNIFSPDADTETIFFTDAGVGNRIFNGLHYNQRTPDNGGGGWNGFSATSELYDLFEGPMENTPGAGQEERRGFVPTTGLGYGILVGQQYDVQGSGAALNDRSGNPLVFTRTLPGLAGNSETTGGRIIKYHPDQTGGSFRPHLILMRFADAHLMKAEAIMRGGTGAESALDLVNELRVLRGATPLATLTEQDVLDERARELYQELWRRNDQIRFGTFDDTWSFKTSTESFRSRFPIPQQAMGSNPNLIQNEGY